MCDHSYRRAESYAIATIVMAIVIPLVLAALSDAMGPDLGLAAIAVAFLLALLSIVFGIIGWPSAGGKVGVIGGVLVLAAVPLVVLWSSLGGSSQGTGVAEEVVGATHSGGALSSGEVPVPLNKPSLDAPE